MKFLLGTASLLPLLLVGCVSIGTQATPGAAWDAAATASAIGPHGSFVTIVVMENKQYNRVVGSPQAPYFNKTLVPQGVLLRNSHAIGHPSEPNYLALFSGSTQGVHGDRCPIYFKAASVASELIAAGKTFAGYSESMPRDAYKGCYNGLYDRNHNPWVEFKSVPNTDNLIYSPMAVERGIARLDRPESLPRHARLRRQSGRQVAFGESSAHHRLERKARRFADSHVGRSRS